MTLLHHVPSEPAPPVYAVLLILFSLGEVQPSVSPANESTVQSLPNKPVKVNGEKGVVCAAHLWFPIGFVPFFTLTFTIGVAFIFCCLFGFRFTIRFLSSFL